MKYKYIFLLSLSFLCSYSVLRAQDADSSTYRRVDPAEILLNPIIDNPASTGLFYGHKIQTGTNVYNPFFVYTRFLHPYETFASYDFAFGSRINNGLGLLYNSSQGGICKDKSIGLSYSYSKTLSISKSFYHKLRAGVSLVYHKTTLELWEYNTFGDMIDPNFGFTYNTNEFLPNYFKPSDTLRNFTGLNFGLWYHNPYGYCGIGTNYFNERDTNLTFFNIKPLSYNISAGGHIYLNKTWSLHPALNIRLLTGNMSSLSSTSPSITCAYYEKLQLGFMYLDMNKPAVLAGFTLGHRVTLSALYALQGTSHLDATDPALISGQLRIHLN